MNIMFGTGASSSKDYESLSHLVLYALKQGIRGFDTAPSYKTEEVLGRCLNEAINQLGIDRSDIFIQTKIDAWQMQLGSYKIISYVDETLDKMQLSYLDSLLIHWPVPEYMEETWKTLCDLQKQGKAKNIGICNVRMRQLHSYLDYKPQIIQIERNPLRTCHDEIKHCIDNDIIVQAYSPLCKFHKKIRDNKDLALIADKYNKNIGQIVLRWHIDTGVTPIFTSTKEHRLKEYTELFDFKLTDDEIAIVNNLNENYKMYLESVACPGF